MQNCSQGHTRAHIHTFRGENTLPQQALRSLFIATPTGPCFLALLLILSPELLCPPLQFCPRCEFAQVPDSGRVHRSPRFLGVCWVLDGELPAEFSCVQGQWIQTMRDTRAPRRPEHRASSCSVHSSLRPRRNLTSECLKLVMCRGAAYL